MLAGWTRIDIAGKPADAFDPPLPALPFALLFLHDESGDTPATDPAFTAELRMRRLRCIAPHGDRAWWLDRVCAEFDPHLTAERHLLDHVAPWIESTWQIDSRAIAVAGIGMGGQGALRFGFRNPSRFPIVASIGGALDFHERFGSGTPLDAMFPSREHARQDTAILHIHGHDWPRHIWFACSPGDPWYRGNDRLHEKLAAIGVPHTADLDTRAGNDHFYKPMFAFIIPALDRESRRLM